MKKIVVVLVGSLACVGIGLGAMYAYSQLRTEPQPQQDTSVTPVETQIPDQVYVRLPGADPVEAMAEDFTRAPSLWVVVSKDHPLSDPAYIPEDLQVLTSVATRSDKSEEERSLRPNATRHLTTMLTDAKTAGYDLMVGSAFRSHTLQNTYYSNYVRTAGEAAANMYSAKPGESEHQTGLAVDISLTSRDCYLETCFGQTKAGKWLAANATKYGFILRYPVDKTEITKYQYEPWHFRYVGKPLATALERSELTLDEAYPYLDAARTELIAAKRFTVQ